MRLQTLLSMVLLSTALLPPCWSPAQVGQSETVILAERPKLAIFAGEVTVDGVSRPELGSALADSMSAGLLKRGQVRVFNLDSAAVADGAMIGSRASSTASRVNQLLDRDIDYLVSFNLVGEDNQYLLTVKKTRAHTHEIIEAHQFTVVGRVNGFFNMMGAILERMDPKPIGKSRPAFPRTQSPAYLAPLPQPQYVQASTVPAYAQQTSAAYDPWRSNAEPRYDLRNVPRALIYRRLGSINYINNNWKFCVVRPAVGVKLRENDPLHVLWSEGDVYANLRVCALDRAGVVADMGHTPDHHQLFQGDEVYGWAPAPPVAKTK